MGNWLLGPGLGSFGLQGMYQLAAGIGLVEVATVGRITIER